MLGRGGVDSPCAEADAGWRCRNGGCGAIMSGLFRMERGQKLRVLCGSMSTMGPHGNSGGGGGSYVVAEDEDDPLVVAGGGGGTR